MEQDSKKYRISNFQIHLLKNAITSDWLKLIAN